MDIKHFGETLRSLRQERGLGQAALSKALNYGKAIISAWETGKCKPSVDAVIAIAKFLM